MDISFTSSVTRSAALDQERDQWEIERNALLAEIAELKAKVSKYEEKEHRTAPLLNLYRRELQVKNGSGAYIINPEVNRLSIVLER